MIAIPAFFLNIFSNSPLTLKSQSWIQKWNFTEIFWLPESSFKMVSGNSRIIDRIKQKPRKALEIDFFFRVLPLQRLKIIIPLQHFYY